MYFLLFLLGADQQSNYFLVLKLTINFIWSIAGRVTRNNKGKQVS